MKKFNRYFALMIAIAMSVPSSVTAVNAVSPASAARPDIDPDTTLWYDECAQDDMEVVTPPSDSWADGAKWDYEEVRALPVGNGRLGAMVYGKTDIERIQINEETIWTGGPHNYANELKEPLTKDNIDDSLKDFMADDEIISSTSEVYEKASKLVLENEISAATKIIDLYFLGNERYQTAYQPFIDLNLSFGHNIEKAENYYRALDVENALATVDYDYEDVHYSRETIASYPDQVIATNIAATDNSGNAVNKLDFSVSLSSEQTYSISKVSDNEIQLKGKVKSQGGTFINWLPNTIHFDARAIVDTDGTVSFNNDQLDISGATYATIYVTGASNYVDYKTVAGYETDDNGNVIMSSYDESEAYDLPFKRCEAIKTHLGSKSYEDVKADHQNDYNNIYSRSEINFEGESKNDTLKYNTTDLRIASFDGYNDMSLVKLYFNYAKYLLISSSRSSDELIGEYGENMLPKGQPANLQGIWNWNTQPGWGSKYTANINVEMNYFMAQIANMSETELPLFDALDELVESGKRTAAVHYGCTDPEAWVLHHNFDLWRGTAPVDLASSGMWPTGGAWLAYHTWEYYQFTQNKEFLEEKAYPILRGSSKFFEEYLKEYTDPETGAVYLVSPASISPEHGDVRLSPTMDNSLIKNILICTANAADIIGIDSEDAAKWREMADKIPPYDTVESGDYLREWLVNGTDESVGDAEHRHPSQLWGLHPGLDVSPYDNTPEEQEIFDAFVNALERRGEGGTGWSVAWRICLWARAGYGDKAFDQLTSLIKKATAPNLFDMHPADIFQIDGNFGGAAGIIELVMQSTPEDITLLPALPAAMKNGSFRNFIARGGHNVSLEWENGNAKTAEITAGKSGDLTVRYINGIDNVLVTDNTGKNIDVQVSDNKQKFTFNAEEGMTYTITGFTETEYIPAPAPTEEVNFIECLNNGNMEGIDGSTNQPWWWGVMKANDDDTISFTASNDAHSGNYSMYVNNRASSESSAMQYITLENNKKYTITAWVKTEEADTVDLVIRYDYWDKDIVAQKKTQAGEWVKLSAEYTTRPSGEMHEFFIVTENTNSGLYIDDVSISYTEPDKLGLSPQVTKEGNKITYSITDPGGAYDLYIAAYSADGTLIKVTNELSGEIDNADNIKIFGWHKDEMRPAQPVILY